MRWAMSREKLGLPWKISSMGYVTSSDSYPIASMEEDTAEEMDFILNAVNNHHELVWRLERALEIIETLREEAK